MIEASLIFNPNAGRVMLDGITEERLVQGLRARDVYVTRVHSNDIPGIPDFVQSLEPGSLLIMAGGDGTMYEVVQVPACRQLSISIIPLGTANNLALSAGIPLDTDGAMDVAAQGRERVVDMGVANDHVFTQVAGVGFHAEAFRHYGRRRVRSFARGSSAVLAALAEWEPQRMSICVDGQSRESNAVQVTVANTPIYGEKYPIASGAMIDDGLLDVLEIMDCMPRLELVRCIIDFMKGREMDPSKVRRVQGRRIEIAPLSECPIPVHADAEPIGYAPVTIEVLPSCLRLMTPA